MGVSYLLPDDQLQSLHQLRPSVPAEVLVEVLLPAGRVRHIVVPLEEEQHGLLAHAEEDHFLVGNESRRHAIRTRETWNITPALFTEAVALAASTATQGLVMGPRRRSAREFTDTLGTCGPSLRPPHVASTWNHN